MAYALRLLLVLLAGLLLAAPRPAHAEPNRQPLDAARQELRYVEPEAGEVFVAWGVNGWERPPSAQWPPGTTDRDGLTYSPMRRDGDSFVIDFNLPAGTAIDYSFHITRLANGSASDIWDANGDPAQDYRTVVGEQGVAEVRSTLPRPIGSYSGPIAASGLPWRAPLLALMLGGLFVGGFVLRHRQAAGSIPARDTSVRKPVAALRALLQSDLARLTLFGLGTRLLLFGLGYAVVAISLTPDAYRVPLNLAHLDELLAAFGRADVRWYMEIAHEGYEQRPFSDDRKANWAFYPLWPLLQRLSETVIPAPVVAGMVASTLCFLGALLLLYQLITLDFDRRVALQTTILAAIFPASYFYSRPGPEALFLLLSVASLLAARRGRWLPAALLGALTVLTRLQGVLLLAPLLYIYYRQYREQRRHDPHALALMLLPAALAGFMVYLDRLTGTPFASFRIQAAWDNNTSYPFAAVEAFLAAPQIIDYYGFDLSALSFAFVVAASVLTVALIWMRQMPREYLIYTLLSLYPIIARDTLTGSLRYLLPIFPLQLGLALLLQRRPRAYTLLVVTYTALLTFYVVGFVQQANWAAN